MYALLSGIGASLALIAAACFARAYTAIHDRFFAYFAAAFAVLGLTSLGLGIRNAPETDEPLAYLPRLAVFAIILFAIVEKNRNGRFGRPRPTATTPRPSMSWAWGWSAWVICTRRW